MEHVDAVLNFRDFTSYFTATWLPKLEVFSPKPNMVLLPCAIAVENLKISCVRRQISLANVRFFTPVSLKSFLQESLILRPYEDKDHVISRKILKFWARNILKSDSDRRDLLLQAIEEDLEVFLEAFKSWKQIFPSRRAAFFDANFLFFAEVLNQFLSQHRWIISIEEAYGQTYSEEKLFQDTLIGGFSPQAWNSLPLLKAVIKLSHHSTVKNLLSGDPNWDALWQRATIHLKNYGVADTDIPIPIPELIDDKKTKEDKNDDDNLHQAEFFITQNSSKEIAQLCEKLHQLLTYPLDGRIAIILSQKSQKDSLEAVLLQKQLHQEKIPFTSSYSIPFSVQTHPIVNAWCQWQKSDHIDDYFQLIQSLADKDLLSIFLKKELEKEINAAVTSLGTHQSSLLLDWTLLETKNDVLRTFLKAWNLLPAADEICAFPTFFPKDITSFLAQELLSLLLPLRFLKEKCSRYSFIEFFETSFQESTSQKFEKLSSSFAKVCLLSPEEALYGTWKYVFFFHCVEHASQPWDNNPWVNSTDWQSHWQMLLDHPQVFSPREDTNTPLGAREKKHLSLLSLRKIQKECSANGSYFSAAPRNGDSLNVPFNLFFLENYVKQHGLFPKLGHENLTKVTEKTISEKISEKSFLHLKKIYQNRRNPQNPFGAWDYSLEASLGERFLFSCKTWESILQNPEESWYRHILQQEPCPTFAEQEWMKLARGTWVHNFLFFPETSKKPQDVPDLIEGHGHICCRAQRFKEKVEIFLSAHGTEPTFIWKIIWNEALSLSRQLFQRVALLGNSLKFRSEFMLPKGSHLQFFSAAAALPLIGRIDLWLQGKSQSHVIDYKTGGDLPLKYKKWINVKKSGEKVASAKGLQLILYGIALRERGWQNIRLLILKPDSPIGNALDSEQIELEMLLKEDSFREFLQIFKHIAIHGILGLRPSLHTSQQTFKRPLAVLPIEDDILQKRCIKTFTCLWA